MARYWPNCAVIVLGRKDTLSRINRQSVNLRDVESHVQQAVFKVLRNSPAGVVARMVTPQGSRSSILVAFLCSSTDLFLTPSIASAIDEELSDRLSVKPYVYGIIKDRTGQVDRNRLYEQADCFTLAYLTVVERSSRRHRYCAVELSQVKAWCRSTPTRTFPAEPSRTWIGTFARIVKSQWV